jgi:hypothetical protein
LAIGDRLDDLRQFLAYLDAPRNHSRSIQLSRISRAWAYVAMGAALEDFVKAFLDELALHINAAQIPIHKLKLGVVSVIQAPLFESLAVASRRVTWEKRAEILTGSASGSVTDLTVGLHPIDGRTIRAEHLKSIWRIYDLPGTPLPSPIHSLALEDLRKGRNAVAHGNDGPVSFGASHPYPDVLKRVEHVEDISIHIALAGARYVSSKGFLR